MSLSLFFIHIIMKWFFIGIIKFISSMFNGNSNVSSKRVNGTFCIISTIIILFTCILLNKSISEEIVGLLKVVFWGGTALLGLGVADKFLNNENK